MNVDTLPEPAEMTAEEFHAEMAVLVTGFLALRGNERQTPEDWHRAFGDWLQLYVFDTLVPDAGLTQRDATGEARELH